MFDMGKRSFEILRYLGVRSWLSARSTENLAFAVSSLDVKTRSRREVPPLPSPRVWRWRRPTLRSPFYEDEQGDEERFDPDDPIPDPRWIGFYRLSTFRRWWQGLFPMILPCGSEREVPVQTIDPAVTVDGNLRDGRRTVLGVFGRAFDVALDHRYILARDDLPRAHVHPDLEGLSPFLGYELIAAGEHPPVGEGEHHVLRVGTGEDVVALRPVVLRVGSLEEVRTSLDEPAGFVVL